MSVPRCRAPGIADLSSSRRISPSTDRAPPTISESWFAASCPGTRPTPGPRAGSHQRRTRRSSNYSPTSASLRSRIITPQRYPRLHPYNGRVRQSIQAPSHRPCRDLFQATGKPLSLPIVTARVARQVNRRRVETDWQNKPLSPPSPATVAVRRRRPGRQEPTSPRCC